MRLLDKYIFFSTIFSIFSEDFSFSSFIDIKLFYVILLINLFLLGFRNQIKLNKNLIYLLGFLILHGTLFVLLGQNSLLLFMAQLIGISLSSIYFYNFLNIYGIKKSMEVYLKFALVIAVLAIPMFYLGINAFADGKRLNGILSEPAHYAAIMLPAAYLFLKRKNYFWFFIIVLTILLSRSSIGYFGLALIIIIPLSKAKNFLKYSLLVTSILIAMIWYLKVNWSTNINSENANVFVRRIKQTYESVEAVQTGQFDNSTNLSTYALLSNFFVTKNSFKDHVFGSGLGSYKLQYEEYYPLMSPPDYLLILEKSKINSEDANSLLFRILVDLGVFGLFLCFIFLFLATKRFGNKDSIWQQSSFFYLLVKLIREGHYFPPEFYFFLLIFLKRYDENSSCSGRLLA